MVFKTCVLSPSFIEPKILFKSLNVSFRGRIFPSASNTFRPSSAIFFRAMSVGADKLKMTFLSAVPPSAPFTPLSAKIPSTVFASVTPPASDFAVPPTVKSASPNC